jgi:hypothetical protein
MWQSNAVDITSVVAFFAQHLKQRASPLKILLQAFTSGLLDMKARGIPLRGSLI